MTDEAIRIFLARGLSDVADRERLRPEHEEVTMTLSAGTARRRGRRGPVAGELTNAAAVAGVLAAAAARAQDWAGLRPADVHWPAVRRPPAGSIGVR